MSAATDAKGPSYTDVLHLRADGCGGVQPAVLAAVERGGVIRPQAALPALY
jgi:hypothetical protein